MSISGTATEARGSWKGCLTYWKCGTKSPEYTVRLMWHEEFDEVLSYGDEPDGWIDLTDSGDREKRGICKKCRQDVVWP